MESVDVNYLAVNRGRFSADGAGSTLVFPAAVRAALDARGGTKGASSRPISPPAEAGYTHTRAREQGAPYPAPPAVRLRREAWRVWVGSEQKARLRSDAETLQQVLVTAPFRTHLHAQLQKNGMPHE